MKKQYLLAATLLALPGAAWARGARHSYYGQDRIKLPAAGEERPEDADRNLKVDLPQSRLEAPAETKAEGFRLDRLEFRASFQAPDSLQLASLISNAGPYQSTLPELSMAMYFPFLESRQLKVSFKAGAGVQTLKRSGSFLVQDQTVQANGNLTLIPFEAGLHLVPEFARFKGIYPEAAISLNPLVGLSAESPLNRGQSLSGMGLTLSAGLATSLRWVWSAVANGNPEAGIEDGPELTADYIQTYGTLDSSGSLRGSGLSLGCRFVL